MPPLRLADEGTQQAQDGACKQAFLPQAHLISDSTEIQWAESAVEAEAVYYAKTADQKHAA